VITTEQGVSLPDLAGYRLHRLADPAHLEGAAVPGLSAEFFRRVEGDRLASVGRYRFAGQVVLLAWGYVDEQHCRYSAACRGDGTWGPAAAGCPTVRVLRDGDRVTGLDVLDGDGAWLSHGAGAGEGSSSYRRRSVP
jgi:hypothetical protein